MIAQRIGHFSAHFFVSDGFHQELCAFGIGWNEPQSIAGIRIAFQLSRSSLAPRRGRPATLGLMKRQAATGTLPATCRTGTGGSRMKTYGMVLAALAVVILGGKVLHAGWTGHTQPKPEEIVQESSGNESEREMVLRWQQNRANHWRGYMMQQQ
jgi:hypothetical protein